MRGGGAAAAGSLAGLGSGSLAYDTLCPLVNLVWAKHQIEEGWMEQNRNKVMVCACIRMSWLCSGISLENEMGPKLWGSL